MIGWNPGFDREIVEYRGLGIDFAAQRCCAWGWRIRLGQVGGWIAHGVLHQPVRQPSQCSYKNNRKLLVAMQLGLPHDT